MPRVEIILSTTLGGLRVEITSLRHYTPRICKYSSSCMKKSLSQKVTSKPAFKHGSSDASALVINHHGYVHGIRLSTGHNASHFLGLNAKPLIEYF